MVRLNGHYLYRHKHLEFRLHLLIVRVHALRQSTHCFRPWNVIILIRIWRYGIYSTCGTISIIDNHKTHVILCRQYRLHATTLRVLQRFARTSRALTYSIMMAHHSALQCTFVIENSGTRNIVSIVLAWVNGKLNVVTYFIIFTIAVLLLILLLSYAYRPRPRGRKTGRIACG